MTTEAVAIKEFKSSVYWHGSWGASKPTAPVRNEMSLYMPEPDYGMIEWIIDEPVDEVEHIGLWFEKTDTGKLSLTDYDGVAALPLQAVEMLRDFGVVVGEDFVD